MAIKFGVSQNKVIYVNLAAIKFGVSPRPVYAVYDRRICWRRQILAKRRNSPNSPNIIARQNLLIYSIQDLLGLAKFSHGLLRYTWRALRGKDCCVPEAQRRTAVWPRSTTDVSTFPSGVSSSDEIPHVSHVVIKVMRRFSRYVKNPATTAITFEQASPCIVLTSITFCTSPTMVSWNVIAVA